MDTASAIAALGALSHETRLGVFRLLVVAGPDGLAAGAIADRLGVRQNTLSTHLGLLARAGLVSHRRRGRTILYAADLRGMEVLLEFLLRDCCAGRPEICGPLAAVAHTCRARAEPA